MRVAIVTTAETARLDRCHSLIRLDFFGSPVHPTVHLQLIFDEADYRHFMFDMLDHALFYISAHCMPISFQQVLCLVHLSHPHQIIVIPMIEETLARYRQVRINAPIVLLLRLIVIVVVTTLIGTTACQVEGDRWPPLGRRAVKI